MLDQNIASSSQGTETSSYHSDQEDIHTKLDQIVNAADPLTRLPSLICALADEGFTAQSAETCLEEYFAYRRTSMHSVRDALPTMVRALMRFKHGKPLE